MSGAPPTSTPPPGAKPLWGSHEGAAAPAAAPVSQSSRHARGTRPSLFGDGPLEPLSVRLLQAAGALAVLLILVVANSFLHSSENPLNPVAAAAERTAEVNGLRFTMEVRATSEAHQPQIEHGTGAVNLETKMALVRFSGVTDDGERISGDMVVEEGAIYMRSPQFRGRLPEGKEWAKMDPSQASGEDSVPAESPDGSLGMLTVSDRVHLAGQTRVQGKRVSRYVSSFEIGEAAAELRAKGEDDLADQCEKLASKVVGPVHAEAFVDGKGLVRRIHIRMASTASGPLETIDSTMNFFDFGSHPQIEAPPEGLVFDMTPLLEQQQEALGQSS